MTPAGLPHSDISGSKRACRSPKLFAACCVLHRLSVPRHPPSTLSNLTIKCLDLMRSAVFDVLCRHRLCISLFLQPVFNCQRTLVIAKISAERNRSIVLTADPCGFCWCGGLGTTEERLPSFHLNRCIGGADRDRTDDPLLAKQVLSQLSYSPTIPRTERGGLVGSTRG
jgi:hypothetical protein